LIRSSSDCANKVPDSPKKNKIAKIRTSIIIDFSKFCSADKLNRYTFLLFCIVLSVHGD